MNIRTLNNPINPANSYPFGMLMPGRTENSAEYRYSFQGQEKDDEIKGQGNSINYKYRMHDPRIGRFFAVDPLFRKYPHYSPYSFSGNRVIDMVELEGLEPANPKSDWNVEGKSYGDGTLYSNVEGFNVYEYADEDNSLSYKYAEVGSETWIEDGWSPTKPNLANEVSAIVTHPLVSLINNVDIDFNFKLEAGYGDNDYYRVGGASKNQTRATLTQDIIGVNSDGVNFLEKTNVSFTSANGLNKLGFNGSATNGNSGLENIDFSVTGGYSIFNMEIGFSSNTGYPILNGGIELWDVSKTIWSTGEGKGIQLKTDATIKIDLFNFFSDLNGQVYIQKR